MKIWKWIFLLLILAACNSGTKNKSQQKQEKQDEIVPPKSENLAQGETSLFDGKTLDGWEITNFGTQGPVLVSEGNIVLNFGDGCTGVTYTKPFPNSKLRSFARCHESFG